MGKPGSGKATLAAKLADRLGVVHVGFMQIFSDALSADSIRLQIEGKKAERHELEDVGVRQEALKTKIEGGSALEVCFGCNANNVRPFPNF